MRLANKKLDTKLDHQWNSTHYYLPSLRHLARWIQWAGHGAIKSNRSGAERCSILVFTITRLEGTWRRFGLVFMLNTHAKSWMKCSYIMEHFKSWLHFCCSTIIITISCAWFQCWAADLYFDFRMIHFSGPTSRSSNNVYTYDCWKWSIF